MNTGLANRTRWLLVVIYAVAMAWMEAAVVHYLRLYLGYTDPYRPGPIPKQMDILKPEVVREAATLVMLLAVGWLAGRTWRGRLGYLLIAFGVWDIFYYVFLHVITGWPNTILDWDILFLIPLPWWGPVLSPCCIALLMILWGTLVTQFEKPERPLRSRWWVWALCLTGCTLALYTFMADALRTLPMGFEQLANMLPVKFNWPLFLAALLLLAAPVADVTRKLRAPPKPVSTNR